MAIQIEGARIKSVTIATDDKGQPKMTGQYELVSTTGVVIAKQSFNSYNEIQITFSAESLRIIDGLYASICGDLNKTLGMS